MSALEASAYQKLKQIIVDTALVNNGTARTIKDLRSVARRFYQLLYGGPQSCRVNQGFPCITGVQLLEGAGRCRAGRRLAGEHLSSHSVRASDCIGLERCIHGF